MGSSGHFDTPFGPKDFPEERPVHTVKVGSFWIDETEVTNRQFARFVEETKYVTFAERPVKPEDFPAEARANLPSGPLHQGAIVFVENIKPDANPNTPGEYLNWWRWDPDANWRAPQGKGSSIQDIENHPVVCITYDDAVAYAKWAGKRLPSEAEWEFAARGGLEGKTYTWGDSLQPDGKWMANTWQGEFPSKNTKDDGFISTAPAKSFPPNNYGLYDMAGNVWEICSDLYDPEYFTTCDPNNPQGPETWIYRDTSQRSQGAPHHVTKGGSFLCHISYCMRYRPAARHSQDTESPTNHTGFRCVKSQ